MPVLNTTGGKILKANEFFMSQTPVTVPASIKQDWKEGILMADSRDFYKTAIEAQRYNLQQMNQAENLVKNAYLQI